MGASLMGVDQAGDDDTPAQILHRHAWRLRRQRCFRPDPGDAAAFHQQRSLRDEAARQAGADEGISEQHQISASWRSSSPRSVSAGSALGSTPCARLSAAALPAA